MLLIIFLEILQGCSRTFDRRYIITPSEQLNRHMAVPVSLHSHTDNVPARYKTPIRNDSHRILLGIFICFVIIPMNKT